MAVEDVKEVGAYRLAVLLLNVEPSGDCSTSLGESTEYGRVADKEEAVGDNAKGLVIVENLRRGWLVLIRERERESREKKK